MLWMTSSFSMGSLAGLGIREGPCSPPGNQKTRIQGYQFERTCVIACVIDSKEHYLLKSNDLKRRWGGKLLLAIKSQDTTLSLRHLCNYSFWSFYCYDTNLH